MEDNESLSDGVTTALVEMKQSLPKTTTVGQPSASKTSAPKKNTKKASPGKGKGKGKDKIPNSRYYVDDPKQQKMYHQETYLFAV